MLGSVLFGAGNGVSCCLVKAIPAILIEQNSQPRKASRLKRT